MQTQNREQTLEPLPKLHYRLSADSTNAYSPKTDSWMHNDNPAMVEERIFTRYDFVASKGYFNAGADIPQDGRAVHYTYDDKRIQYRKKQQFIVGPYLYVLRKSEQHSGNLPSGRALSYCAWLKKGGSVSSPARFGHDISTLPPGLPLLSDIKLNQYNYISPTPVYVDCGTTGSNLYRDTRYQSHGEFVFSGMKGSNPPYWEVWAEDIVPFAKDPYPSGCFVDKTEDITLSWSFGVNTRRASFEGLYNVTGSVSGRIIEMPCQKSAVLRWKQQGNSQVHTINLTNETKVVLPKGQITADSFDWQVVITTDDNVSGKSDQWFHATTNNDSKSTARIVSPKRVVVDGSCDNEFVWEHIIATGTRPTKSELQYSTDNAGSWNTLATVNTRETRCTIAAGTIPAGLLQWRVRTYNTNNVAGEWSEAVSINSYSAPPKPQIVSVGESPLPQIRWSGEGQLCAEVRIDRTRTRTVYGTGQSLLWDTRLEDGEHLVQVRVQNSYSLWSPWAEHTVVTKNYSQKELLLLARSIQNGVELHWERSFPKMELYRDGNRIAVLDGGFTYTDWESVGTCQYELYGIDEDGYYTKSTTVRCAPTVEYAALGDENGSWLSLRGRYHAPPEHQRTVLSLIHYEYYVGRREPVAYPSGQREVVHRFAFSLRRTQQEILSRLEALSGTTVLYKDVRGDFAKGTLQQLHSSHNGQYIEVQFEIVESCTEGQKKPIQGEGA